MFYTQPASERPSSVQLDREIKRWSVVERDLETPWFHVSLELQEEGFIFEHTLLVADIAQLDLVLGQLPRDVSIRSLMLVTPPSMNHSEYWRMERVVRLRSKQNKKTPGITFQIKMECGKSYTLKNLNTSEAKLELRCIYEEMPKN